MEPQENAPAHHALERVSGNHREQPALRPDRSEEFEALRDSILAIGGALDTTMYGRPVDLRSEPYSTRRTIYGFIDRSDVADLLINFDFAPPDLPTGRRHETTVPQQALFLMNSPLVVQQARKLVRLAEFRACDDDAARIRLLYDRIWQRPPRPEELELGLDFVSQIPATEQTASAESAVRPVSNDLNDRAPQKQKLAAGQRQRAGKGAGAPGMRPPLNAWEEYAHALLQANETSFVN
jgi:Protein of unknown function (DUF1553)